MIRELFTIVIITALVQCNILFPGTPEYERKVQSILNRLVKLSTKFQKLISFTCSSPAPQLRSEKSCKEFSIDGECLGSSEESEEETTKNSDDLRKGLIGTYCKPGRVRDRNNRCREILFKSKDQKNNSKEAQEKVSN